MTPTKVNQSPAKSQEVRATTVEKMDEDIEENGDEVIS